MSILNDLIESGDIFLDESIGEYVGKASDGIDVCLGDINSEESVERYLSQNPGPEYW